MKRKLSVLVLLASLVALISAAPVFADHHEGDKKDGHAEGHEGHDHADGEHHEEHK